MSVARIYKRQVSGVHHLEIGGVTVATEGDMCRDQYIRELMHVNRWGRVSLAVAADIINGLAKIKWEHPSSFTSGSCLVATNGALVALANAEFRALRLREHFEALQLQLERYRDIDRTECDFAWFISRVGHHINQALVTGESVDGLKPPIAKLTPEHVALEMRLRGMVKWLEENQPDVFKRGIWESIP